MRPRTPFGLPLAAMFVCSTIAVFAAELVPDSPLADAVKRRDKQAVQSLLKKKADVNAPQSDGATALHWAAYLNDADTSALLIRAGANVNARNNYGVTPLALAAETGERGHHRSADEGRRRSERPH